MDSLLTECSVTQFAGKRIVDLVASHLDVRTPTRSDSREYEAVKNRIISAIAGGLLGCNAANMNYDIDDLPENSIPIDRENLVEEIAMFKAILSILEDTDALHVPFEGALSELTAVILSHTHAYFRLLEESY